MLVHQSSRNVLDGLLLVNCKYYCAIQIYRYRYIIISSVSVTDIRLSVGEARLLAEGLEIYLNLPLVCIFINTFRKILL